MPVDAESVGIRTALSATDLRVRVRRSERRHQILLLLLMAPSVAFVAVFFAWPIAMFLFRSIDNPEVVQGLPATCAALEPWKGQGAPPEAAYRSLAKELLDLKDKPEFAVLARRLNYNETGFRSLLFRTARHLPLQSQAPAASQLVEIEPRWGTEQYWGVINNECSRLTSFYVLAALDLRRTANGAIETVPDEIAVFLDLFVRTLRISFGVATLCLLLGFPVAVVMARATPQTANVLLMLVLVPFWTSLLVRSTAWVILLQNQGLVNQALIWTGLLDEPVQLVFNRIGLYIAMVHILLPFMVLPLYSVLKGIPREYMRSAASLGANPLQVFRRVYLPLAMPGVFAGSSLVFVLSLGYYITPALVGGPSDQMVGYFIAYFTNSAVNWGMASALGTILLFLVLLIYLIIVRLVGVRAFRFN